MPPKNRFITCEICENRASRSDLEKRMFMARFPLDEARCKQWVKFVGKEDLIYVPIEKLHTLKYVCGNHFDNTEFNKKGNRLKKCAIPSKNLKAEPLPDEMLLEFPSHIYSNIDVTTINNSQGIKDKKASLFQVGSSKSDSCKARQQLLAQESSDKKKIQSHTKKQSPTSESPTSGLESDHDYSVNHYIVLSHKRKRRSSSDLEVSPHKRNPIKKINLSKRKMNVLQEGNVLPPIKSLALKPLIKTYVRTNDKQPAGKEWTPLEKALAIALYKKSPRTFQHLQHLKTSPRIRTLQILLQSIVLEPGVSKTILDPLKKKVAKLNKKDRLCALLFDEIALKRHLIFNPRTDKVDGFVDLGENQCRSSEIADHALVFMLQGLHKKIKQPVAYYFVKGKVSTQSLAVLIKDVIKAVTDVGISVITTVCDQGPTNIGSLNQLKKWCGIPITSNYFLLNDMKIYIMFDIPHLFKSLRNNFQNGGEIVINGIKGKWSHLLDVVEKNLTTLHFKKLTALHMKPTFRTKMKVKLDAEVLSNTVAAILKLMAETYGDSVKAKEMLDTAQVVESFDQLFDCTNGPSSSKDIIRNRRENVSKKTNHVELWSNYKKIISTMYFLKSDNFLRLKNIRCVHGYVTSLSSLEDIWKYVESKGFKYLNLRQLNLDCLENLFGMIRQHSPTKNNPTCHHFTAAFKSNILTKLSTPNGRRANCEEDNSEAIIDFEDFVRQIKNSKAIQLENLSPEKLLEQDVEIPTIHLPELDDAVLPNDFEFPDDDAEYVHMEKNLLESFKKQPTVYVAGYIASMVLKKLRWQCENCEQSLKIKDPEQYESLMYSYIQLRELWYDKESFTYPTLNLCKLVDIVTLYFEVQIKPILHERHISHQAVTMMLSKCDNLSWICDDHKDRLLHMLLVRLSNLLIRNECHHINLSFVKADDSSANGIKRLQQRGIIK